MRSAPSIALAVWTTGLLAGAAPAQEKKTLTIVTYNILGDQPVVAGKKDLFPSDHFGVLATFSRE